MKSTANSTSIKSRLLITNTVFISLVLTVVAVVTLVYFKKIMREEIQSRQFSAVSAAAHEIDKDIEQRQKALVLAASKAPPNISASREIAQQWLDNRIELDVIFNSSLTILDRDGAIIAAFPHRSDEIGKSRAFRDYFKKTIQSDKPYISDPFIALSSKEPAIMITVPFRNGDGAVTGVLCGRVDLLKKNGVLDSHQEKSLGKKGYFYLFAQDRTMIMHPDRSRIMEQDVKPGVNELFDRALEGFEGSGETVNSRGMHVLSSFKRLNTTNWIMAANIPVAEAFKPITNFRNKYLQWMLVLLLVSVLISLKSGAAIINPLNDFTERIQSLVQPGADHKLQLDSTRPDELGLLAQAFNKLQEEVLKREQESVEYASKLNQILNTTNQGIFGSDMSGHCTFMNKSALHILGYQLDDCLGKDIHALIHHSHAGGEPYPVENCPMNQSRVSGLPCRIENEVLWHKNGTTIPVEYSSYPIIEKGEIHGTVVTFSDVTERKHFESDLRKLSRAVTQSPVSIVITNLDGDIEFVNPKFSEVTGYTFEEAIGQNPRILNTHSTPPETYKQMWSTISKGGEWDGEFVNKTRDGQTFWEHAVISALRDESGSITHYLAVKEDITEKKIMLEKLNEAKVKAEAATRAKSSFLSTMSHEIRTPMNGVIGMTSLLIDTDLSPEQRDYAEIIRNSGENLLSLINDILDFSKIEAGKLDLEILEFDLRTMMEDAAELLSLRAAEKGLELICRIDPVVPWYLRGDPGKIRQIITNLVGNAIKFTHQGEVVIGASLQAEQDTTVTLLFEVADTGIGIPADRLDDVFAAFTQADSSTTRKYGGSGLGLAICRQRAELMGGDIGVTSTFGAGSTFWFTVRFEKQPEQNKANVRTAETNYSDIIGTRILIIGDNASNRKLMTTLLHHWGCRCETVADGFAGLALLNEAVQSQDPFKLALMDQEMPEMDGRELGRRIKADPQISTTLLIMVTSLGQRGDAAKLEQIGFDGYLSKPVRESQLHDCISLVLGRKNADSESQRQLQGIVTRYTVAECAEKGVRILLAEDNIINQKVAQNMLNKLGYKADVVANGREAIRALELINYDLVLMDCMMPEMDGFEATKVIRDHTSKVINHCVPIVALTANAMKSDREMCLLAGMNDYLAKPVKKVELSEIVSAWCGGANKTCDE